MTPPIENVNEDEYLDDPIKLVFEQDAVEANHQIDGNINKNSSYEEKSFKEKSYSDILQLVKLKKSICTPVKVTLIDCAMFPWFYKGYKERIIKQLACLKDTEDDTSNDTDSVIDIGDSESDDYLTVKSFKQFKSTIEDQNIGKYLPSPENIKLKAEIEKALKQKHQSKIDLRKNVGLVGLIIEHKIFEPDVLMDDQYLRTEVGDNVQRKLSLSTIESYLDAADKVIDGCEKEFLQILHDPGIKHWSTPREHDSPHLSSKMLIKSPNTIDIKEHVTSKSRKNNSRQLTNAHLSLNVKPKVNLMPETSNAIYLDTCLSGVPQNNKIIMNNNKNTTHLQQNNQPSKNISKERLSVAQSNNNEIHQGNSPRETNKKNKGHMSISENKINVSQNTILGNKPNPHRTVDPSLTSSGTCRPMPKSQKLNPKLKLPDNTKKKNTVVLQPNSSSSKTATKTKNVVDKDIQRSDAISCEIINEENSKKLKRGDKTNNKPNNQLHYYSLTYAGHVKNDIVCDAGVPLKKDKKINAMPYKKSRLSVLRILPKQVDNNYTNPKCINIVPMPDGNTAGDLIKSTDSFAYENYPNNVQNRSHFPNQQSVSCIFSKPTDETSFNTDSLNMISQNSNNIYSKTHENCKHNQQHTSSPPKPVSQANNIRDNNFQRPIPVSNSMSGPVTNKSFGQPIKTCVNMGPLNRKYNSYHPFTFLPPGNIRPNTIHGNQISPHNSSQRLISSMYLQPPNNIRLTAPNQVRKTVQFNRPHNFPQVNTNNYFSTSTDRVLRNNFCKPMKRNSNLSAPMHSSSYVASSFSHNRLPSPQPLLHTMAHFPSKSDPRCFRSSTPAVPVTSVSTPLLPLMPEVSSATVLVAQPSMAPTSMYSSPLRSVPPFSQPLTTWATSPYEQRCSHITQVPINSNANNTSLMLPLCVANNKRDQFSTKNLLPVKHGAPVIECNEIQKVVTANSSNMTSNNTNLNLLSTSLSVAKPKYENNLLIIESQSAVGVCNETKNIAKSTLNIESIEHVKTKTEMLEELDKDITIEETDWENINKTQYKGTRDSTSSISKKHNNIDFPETTVGKINQPKGYSAPILPIPSTIEILEKVKTSPTIIKNEITEVPKPSSGILKAPVLAPCDNKSNPKKRDDVKKISLDEYKKRKSEDINLEGTPRKMSRKHHSDKKHPNKKHKHRNHSVDSDLGYDSDTTVII